MIFAKATTGEHKGERFECYYKLDEDAGKRYCEDGYFALVEQPVMEQYFQQVAEESGCQFKVTVSLTGEVGEKYTTDISTDELKEYIDGRIYFALQVRNCRMMNLIHRLLHLKIH